MRTLGEIVNGHKEKVLVPVGAQFRVFRVNITKAGEPEELGDWIYLEEFRNSEYVQGTCVEAVGEATCDLYVFPGSLGDLVITRADEDGPEYFGSEAVADGLITVS